MLTINKNTVQFNCSTIDTANQLKNELVDFMRYQLYPKLEKVFEEYDTSERIWQIDQIPISFKIDDVRQWKNEFLHESLAQVRLYLRQQQPQPDLQQISADIIENSLDQELTFDKIDQIIYFLKTGSLKNNQSRENFHQIIKNTKWTVQNKAQVLKAISTDVNSILRFVFSMPNAVAKKILGEKKLTFPLYDKTSKNSFLSGKQFSSEFKDFLEIIYRAEPLPNGLQKNFTQFLTTHFEVTTPEFQGWLDIQSETVQTKFQNLEALPKEKKEPSEIYEDGDSFSEVEHDIRYINNGGLILLHPFLQNLFKKLCYLKNDQSNFKSKQLQNRAVLITQYLINFEERIFENDLVLNKVLCGIKVTDAINTKIDFSDREKELCRDLLSSIISHWKILKNTSHESLQASFLQRNAKLKKEGNAWKLTVEKNGIDVLLNDLPWGIGTVRKPWMKNYLSCNWSG